MREKVEQANALAVSRLKNAQPFWVDVEPAHVIFPGMERTTLLHAGPPVCWDNMCGPMRGAVAAVLKYEGLAASDEEAFELAGSGKIKFEPCHHYGAVGPMTGITSYSMPLYVVENKDAGNFSYSTINEGAGDVIRFGAYSENTVKRLKWIETTLGPALKKAVKHMGGVNLKVIMAQSLNMGDELHMRNGASTNLFIKTLIQSLTETVESREDLSAIVKFITTNNDQFFLNLAMSACKCSADAAHGVDFSTMVTAMARNGVEIGIRVSGLGDTWFTAPAAEVEGLYFSGYTKEDANKDIGDSAIMETGGLGGFAIAAAPAIIRFLGAGTYQDAVNYTTDMYEISLSESEQFAMPNMDFRGTPIGIDIVKVIETGITPIINTAIVSSKPGVGMIGAGISKAPIQMFAAALLEFGDRHGL